MGVEGSAQAELPTLDAEALRNPIKENDLKESRSPERRRRSRQRQRGRRITPHGRVDATRISRQSDLNDVIKQARANPWHLMKHGLLHRTDGLGQRMFAMYAEPLTKITRWEALPQSTRSLLGEEYDWST